MMIQASDSDAAPATEPARAAVPPNPAASTSPTPAGRYLWWLLPALLIAGFGLLIWQVRTHGPVTTLDIHVRDRIQSWAKSPSMRWSFHPGRAMADLGNETFTFPILIAVTALAARAARSWRPVVIGAGAFATLVTVILLKKWIDRPGPGKAVLGNANLGFFPSGHTADAVLAYGTSALLLCTFVLSDRRLNANARRSRQTIVAVAIVLVSLTIFGLLWSNFHWLSDTVGSLFWCGAAVAVMSRFTGTARS